MSAPCFPRAVVAGAAGGFGRTFRALLAAHGSVVTGTDRVPPEGPGDRWFVADAAAPPPALLAELSRTDVLVLCLPEAALYPALEPLVGALPPGALVVDTTSVKSRYAAVACAVRPDVELLSIEPMFAPDVGFAGQHVIAIPLRDGPRSAAFRPLLRSTGAQVTELSADQHDRHAAATQVAVHAALLAYAATLRRLGHHGPGGPSTPPQRALMALLARIATRDPGTYWHIQRDNPYGAEARAVVRDALIALDETVARNDRGGFDALLADTAAAFGPDLAPMVELSDEIVRSARPQKELSQAAGDAP
ncbi:hypothetical protein [Actinomadura sp. 3N508]|uniref:hypothetical protein n=1 Tax=Actinomadura sp. 3N508 TaxID=3375153 RepID=UPI0037BBA7FD